MDSFVVEGLQGKLRRRVALDIQGCCRRPRAGTAGCMDSDKQHQRDHHSHDDDDEWITFHGSVPQLQREAIQE